MAQQAKRESDGTETTGVNDTVTEVSNCEDSPADKSPLAKGDQPDTVAVNVN